MITSKLVPYLIEQANSRAMQSLNVVLPDKEDFQRWIKEVKQEIILELRKEIAAVNVPSQTGLDSLLKESPFCSSSSLQDNARKAKKRFIIKGLLMNLRYVLLTSK